MKLVLPSGSRTAGQTLDFDMTTGAGGEVEFNLLVRFQGDLAVLDLEGVRVMASIGPIATVCANRTGVYHLAQCSAVQRIELSKYHDPCLDISRASVHADKVHNAGASYRGRGVIVGVFDSGIDWRHEDFIDEQGKSRILYLWDMTDNGGTAPSGFNYGSEYTQAQINDELDGAPTGLVREKDNIGHGTHVAGIAAGDGSATGHGMAARTYVGMAPEADLIIVKGGENSYTDVNEVNGLAYITQKAKALGRPVVINYSLAGHLGAHDGTDLVEQAIDAAAAAGQIVVVAAGNEGAELIHAGAWVAQGSAEMPWFVVKENADDIWIDIWHSGNDVMELSVLSPQGHTTSTVQSGSLSNWKYWDTEDGRIGIIAPEKNSNNHDYEFIIFLTRTARKAVTADEWYFVLQGIKITNGRFDAWTNASRAEFSNYSEDECLVGIPGTARQAITVASYCTRSSWPGIDGRTNVYYDAPTQGDISYFSSPGPTRDNREKPDIAAPGHGIISALSQDAAIARTWIAADGVHCIMQGTSMAAPHVAGCVALMLQKNPTLTPATARSILTRTALPDDYTGTVWNNSWGYGKVQIDQAMKLVSPAAEVAKQKEDETPQSFFLSRNYPNPFNPGTTWDYQISEPAQVKIAIYDLLGRCVRTLVNERRSPGSYVIQWNGQDHLEQPVASGIYFCIMKSGPFEMKRPLVLLR